MNIHLKCKPKSSYEVFKKHGCLLTLRQPRLNGFLKLTRQKFISQERGRYESALNEFLDSKELVERAKHLLAKRVDLEKLTIGQLEAPGRLSHNLLS
ncbi:MAG: hypothetical protein JNK90_03320 [Planctomycetaceae bacterium]|nr:hypothetical protein [Planctomycetaceae bacterium]